MQFSSIVCAAILFAGLVSQSDAAQSVDPPFVFSRSTQPTGAYYEQNGSNECGHSSSSSSGASGGPPTVNVCKINFASPPNGKYLVIEHVACNLVLDALPLADVSLATASGANETRLLPLEPTLETQADALYYSLNDSVLYVANSAPRIVVHGVDDERFVMACQISGHLNSIQ